VTDAVKVFLLTFSALFPIVDPLAGSPFFLAMTDGYLPETRRALSWRVSFNSLFLMLGSYFIGAHVLNFFGVSLPVVQVGGGLVVVSMGWTMLMEKEESHETAFDCRPRVDFRRHYSGCQCHASLWISHSRDPFRDHRHGCDRSDRLPLLRFR